MTALDEQSNESSIPARLLKQIKIRSESEQRAILAVLEKRPVKGRQTASTAFGEQTGEPSLSSCLFQQVMSRPEDEQKAILKVLEKRAFKERRKHVRRPYFMVVNHNTRDRACTDFIQDISAGGVFIATPMTFSVGNKMSLAFPLPNYQDHIRIGGEVVRTCPQGVGVKFRVATPDQRTKIRSLMEMT